MADRNGKDDRLAGKGSRRILDRLLHKLPYDQAVGSGVCDLAFEFGSLEVDLLDVLALGDQFTLLCLIQCLTAYSLELELRADLQHFVVAQVGRNVLDGFVERIGECGI